MVYWSSLLFSTFATIILIPLLMPLAVRLHAMDAPSERKVHTHPIPRCGGLAIFLGAVLPVIFWGSMSGFTRAYLLGVAVIILFGLLDDIRGLGFKAKLLGQIAAALIIVFYGGVTIKFLGDLLPQDSILPEWISIPLSILTIVGVTNAINLADGLDGLAGGISFLGFCCIGFLAYQQGNTAIVLIAVSLSGALFGFLRFNTYPASLFMGDTGSQLLGFSAITLLIALTQGNTPLSPLLPLIILGFPVLDTLTVMAERIVNGKSPFAADCNHFHHRLMRFGFPHADSVLIIYMIQALLIVFGFVFRFDSEWLLLLSYSLFSGIVVGLFAVADHKKWKFPQFRFVDLFIREPLVKVRLKAAPVQIAFHAVSFGLPAVLLFTCFFPRAIPAYVSAMSAAFALILILLRIWRSSWLQRAMQISLYLLIPFLIYMSYADKGVWVSPGAEGVLNFSYLGLTLFVILTLGFTRSRKGFRSTPLDFLIFFAIIVIVPRLSFENLSAYQLGIICAKVLMLFFGIEVLIGELREKLDSYILAVVTIHAVVAFRGLHPSFSF